MSKKTKLLEKVLRELKTQNKKLDSLASNVNSYIGREIEQTDHPTPPKAVVAAPDPVVRKKRGSTTLP